MATLGAGVLVWAIGPGAPMLIGALADGVRVGQVGRLAVNGATGVWLGDLRFAEISIVDSKGSWAQANDVAIRWRPLRMMQGAFDVASVSAAAINVERAPKLSFAKSSASQLRLNVDRIHCAQVSFDALPELGAQSFDLSGALALERGSWRRAQLDLTSNSETRDHARLDLVDGVFTLDAFGARGGLFDRKLNLGDETRAMFRFVDGAGAGQWTVGGEKLFSVESVKQGDVASFSARLTPAALVNWRPSQASLKEPIDANGQIGPEQIVLTASGAGIALRVDAPREQSGRIADATKLAVKAQSVRVILPSLPAGAASFEGTLLKWRALEGVVQIQDIGGLAVSAQGPVRGELNRDSRRLDFDLAFRAQSRADPRLRAELTGGAISGSIESAGNAPAKFQNLKLATKTLRANGRSEKGRLRGDWAVTDLSAWQSNLGGAGSGAWMFAPAQNALPARVTLEGRTRRLRAGRTLAPLLDEAMNLSLAATLHRGLVEFEQIKLAGSRVRIGGRGRLEKGLFDLALEASARGPFPIGEGVIEGPIDAQGRLRGPLGSETLELETSWPAMNVGGARARNVNARWSWAAKNGRRSGSVDVTGDMFGAPFKLAGPINFEGANFASSQMSAMWRGISIVGPVNVDRDGLALDMAVAGDIKTLSPEARGAISGRVRLAPNEEEANLGADLMLGKGRWGQLAINSASVMVSGAPSALQVVSDLKALSAGAPIRLGGDGTFANQVLMFRARGDVAGQSIVTRAPLSISFRDGATSLDADVAVGDGAFTARLAQTDSGFDFVSRLERAPLAVLGPWVGEAISGAATGQIALSRHDAHVEGEIGVNLVQARLSARASDPIDARLDGALKNGDFSAEIKGSSREGLQAFVKVSAPLNVRAQPLQIALDGARGGSLSWSIAGKAESVWPLIGARDQELGGLIDAKGAATFAPGRLKGSGAIALTGGRFTDKESGFSLRDINATVLFDESGAQLQNFSGRDDEGGSVRATGAATSLRAGEVKLELTRLQVLERPEAKVRASGPLTVAWTNATAKASGALRIDEAVLSPAGRARASFAEIEVIEINRPDEDAAPAQPLVSRTLARVMFDMQVSAPGRVFVRGRGLDSEWSLDAVVRGDAAEPALNGQAQLVRGDYRLAGRVFDLESGLVRLNGPLSQARLDVVAVRQESDLEARIALSGTLIDPKATLSSVPALPEDEILPQVLFGRSGASLSPLEAAQAAASLAELTGRSAFNVAGIARDLIGLDRLDVRNGGDGLRIAGGKYLTRDVYLEVARNSLGAAESQVEWRVQPRFIVISSFAPDGDRRVSLRWRREY